MLNAQIPIRDSTEDLVSGQEWTFGWSESLPCFCRLSQMFLEGGYGCKCLTAGCEVEVGAWAWRAVALRALVAFAREHGIVPAKGHFKLPMGLMLTSSQNF